MTRLRVVIPGRPRGWRRAFRDGRSGRVINPRENVSAADEIWAETQRAMARTGVTRFRGATRLTIWAVFRVPVSWPKRVRAEALDGLVWHTAKPDEDNIKKLIKDALQDQRARGQVTELRLYSDDSEVSVGICAKRFGYPERTDVLIETLDQPPAWTEWKTRGAGP